MQRIVFPFLLSCFSFSLLHAQTETKDYLQGYFRWPVNLKPDIVANLGELRPNHWHMGLDVRTNGQENHQVYAAAAGYIAYVGIRPLSFGRFVIINHPNGLSTLYGHLNDFAPALEKYVTEQQYQKESWAVELEIPKDRFPVQKGSFIAYSGTTGGSQGPHVHFEIRDTRTGKCLTPLLYDMPLQDNVPPSIIRLAVYDRSVSTYASHPQLLAVKKVGGDYMLAKNSVLETGSREISFGIQAFDRMSGSNNQDGIYSATSFLDGIPVNGFIIDSIDYDETGYVNAHIDYPLRSRGGPFIQHLCPLPGDRSSVYRGTTTNGVLVLGDTAVHEMRIEVKDAYRNKTNLRFNVRFATDAPIAARPEAGEGQLFLPNYVNILEKPGFEMYLPETCLYDTVRSVYSESDVAMKGAVSASYQVNDASIPVQGNLRVRIKSNLPIPVEWMNRIVIQRTSNDGRNVRKAEWQDQWISAEFSDFGNFRAFVDLAPPSINEPGRGDTINLSAAKRIVFTPSDNFGIGAFRAELDGQWLRFTNDKGRSWIYRFDERCPDGVHELKVTVTDLVGNLTTRTWWFKKYPYVAPLKKKNSKRKKVAVRKHTVTKKKKK